MARSQLTPTGFTLIELLVVVTLTTLLMITTSIVFMIFMVSNQKAVTIQAMKNEGGHALNQIEFLLRNSISLTPFAGAPVNSDGCEPASNKIAFSSLDGGVTEIMAQTDPADSQIKIASNSGVGTGTGVFLTSGKYELLGDNLNFICVESPDGQTKHVTISFTLRKGNPAVDEARDITVQDFSTGVTLRN